MKIMIDYFHYQSFMNTLNVSLVLRKLCFANWSKGMGMYATLLGHRRSVIQREE